MVCPSFFFFGDQDNEVKWDIDLEAVMNQIYQGSEYPCRLVEINCSKWECSIFLFPPYFLLSIPIAFAFTFWLCTHTDLLHHAGFPRSHATYAPVDCKNMGINMTHHVVICSNSFAVLDHRGQCLHWSTKWGQNELSVPLGTSQNITVVLSLWPLCQIIDPCTVLVWSSAWTFYWIWNLWR